MLEDFGQAKQIIASDIYDLVNWPQSPLVILDTALSAPQANHPWSRPETGRPLILRALSLAAGALTVCASVGSISELPKNSPLLKLWQNLPDSAWPGWLPLQSVPFWEALDKATVEALMVLPPFDPSWWPPLSNNFLCSLRRKVKLTVLCEVPPDGNRDYVSQVIRELRLYGGNVILAQGFADLMTLIDNHHFSLGFPGGPPGHKRWPFLTNLELPKTVPLLSQLLQSKILQAKLGPGGLHNCPLCGWPFLLINQGKPRNFADQQSLRLGCLNPSCATHKYPRPLDERWPFLEAPLCPQDGITAYTLRVSKRHKSWVCPKHGDQCPIYRMVPGDISIETPPSEGTS
jgi:hypothetical protein